MLNHLANGTCPDIAFAVNVLMCYVSLSLETCPTCYCVSKDNDRLCYNLSKGRFYKTDQVF
jgi:hypothetical protein